MHFSWLDRLKYMAKDDDDRSTLWILAGVPLVPLLMLFDVPTSSAVVRALAFCCGCALVDHGVVAGIIHRSIRKRSHDRWNRYVGAEAVAWGTVMILFGLGAFAFGVMVPF